MTEFTQKLLKAKVLTLSEYPNRLPLPAGQVGGFLGFGAKSKFWERIYKLRNHTDSGSQSFSESYEGSTGWEYEMMLAFVNGKFFYSQPTTIRNYTQVSSRHSLTINTKMQNKTIVDEVVLDEKVVGSLRYYLEEDVRARSKAIEANSYLAGFVCHFHTHPQMKRKDETQSYYHFFSTQDMQSLISSNVPLMGLVADKLWLVGKTKEFLELLNDDRYTYSLGSDLAIVTRSEKQGPEVMEQAAAEFFHKYKLAGYVAPLGSSLRKLEYDFSTQMLRGSL